MRWLRSHTQLGSCAALLALTIQLALSFGHIHLNGNLRSGFGPIALRWATEAPPASPDASIDPARHKPVALVDDFCVICAAMQLAHTPTAAASVPLPASVSEILPEPSGDFAIAASPYRLFRARAPPHA